MDFVSQHWDDTSDSSSLADSGFDSSYSHDSVDTDLQSYVYANGRKYHLYRAGQYHLPCDTREMKRLELQHHLFTVIAGGRLHLAPLENPTMILDIGTGAGEWAIDIAEQYPDAKVIGNDLSRTQPPWVPSNCTFEVDDAESAWVYPNDHFDYIHMRNLSGCFEDWPLMLTCCFEHLKPGGYLEFQDYGPTLCVAGEDRGSIDMRNPTVAPSLPFADWWHQIVSLGLLNGRPLAIADLIPQMLEDAGFTDVVVEVLAWPLTAWPENKDLDQRGKWGRDSMIEGVTSFSLYYLMHVYGYSEQQVKDRIAAVVADLANTERRYWAPMHFVYAKKPEN